MALLKKLSLAPLFLVMFGSLIYLLNPLFSSYDVIFSLSWNTLTHLIILAALILLSSLLFTLFACFSQDWKLVLPIGIAAALLPIILTIQPLSIILAVGTLVSIFLTYLTLENRLKSYLTFETNSLLGPSIRHMATLLVLVISLSYFLSINKLVQQNGFQIPDSLIDTALKFTNQPQTKTTGEQQPTLPSLSKEQIDLLKKNPDLLKQSGLDSKILDSLNQNISKATQVPAQITQDLIKQTVKDQLQNLLKPYLGFIPAALALILFLTLESLVSLLTILIYPLLWLIFYILEKSGFIKFTTEQRPVKKMVI